jgi:hypothetical protein
MNRSKLVKSKRRESMESKWKRSVVCLVLLLGVLSMTAVSANKDRIGTAGAQELLIPVGARGTALGGISMVFSSGIDALYWNPAGVSRIEHGVEGLFSHMNYLADINVNYGAVAVQAGDFGTLGFSLKNISFGDIPLTTEVYPDGTGDTYSPTFLTLGATFSKLLTDRISVGVTASLIDEKILSTSATGLAFDIGIQYRNLGIQGLQLAVAVKNIGPTMTFAGSDLLKTATASDGLRGPLTYAVQAAAVDLPSSMEIGVGYERKFDEKNSAELGIMFRNNNYQDDEYNFGGEYNFQNMFFLRGGYTFAPQADKDPTGTRSYIYDYSLGAGVHYSVGGVDLAFDYAYRHVKFFDANNVVSLRLGF